MESVHKYHRSGTWSLIIRNKWCIIRFLPYRLINQAFELYSLLFGPSLQPPAHRTLSRIIFISTESFSLSPLQKARFHHLSHFLKNKKHTNFNRCLHLYANQKLNKKKSERRILYKPKLSHFTTSCEKSPLRQNASRKKAFNIKTLPVTMAILISLWSSRNPQSPYCPQITVKENAHEHFFDEFGEFFKNKTPAQAFIPPANEKKMGTIWIFVHYAVYGSGRGRCRDFLVLKWGGA